MLFRIWTWVWVQGRTLYIGVHIGVTWWMRLNRPFAPAMRPFCQITLTTRSLITIAYRRISLLWFVILYSEMFVWLLCGHAYTVDWDCQIKFTKPFLQTTLKPFCYGSIPHFRGTNPNSPLHKIHSDSPIYYFCTTSPILLSIKSSSGSRMCCKLGLGVARPPNSLLCRYFLSPF